MPYGREAQSIFLRFLSGPYICINSILLKNLPANPGDLGSVPGLGRSPAGGNGNLLQYSCLGNPWAEEPDRLQPMESQRVRHDLATQQCRLLLHCFSPWGCMKLSLGPVTSMSSQVRNIIFLLRLSDPLNIELYLSLLLEIILEVSKYFLSLGPSLIWNLPISFLCSAWSILSSMGKWCIVDDREGTFYLIETPIFCLLHLNLVFYPKARIIVDFLLCFLYFCPQFREITDAPKIEINLNIGGSYSNLHVALHVSRYNLQN